MKAAIGYSEQTLIRSLLQLHGEVQAAGWERLDAAARSDHEAHQRAYQRQHEALRTAARLRQWLRQARAGVVA